MAKVTILKAKVNQPAKLRIVGYGRVSSNSKDQENSLDNQVSFLKQATKYYPDTILTEIYLDEGITGTSKDKRDDFNRMLYDARQHKFDRILCKSVSRFARNTTELLESLRELTHLNVSILFVSEGLDTAVIQGELLLTIIGYYAQSESMLKAETSRKAFQMQAKLGIYHFRVPPYGYDRDQNKNLIVNEYESNVKKRILKDLLSGIGINSIAKCLDSEGVPPPKRAKKWHPAIVSAIIQSEVNCGNVLLQKRYNDEFPFKQKKNRGQKEKYYLQDTHEPIFNKEDYEKIKQVFDIKHTLFNCEHIERKRYALTGKVQCGNCGKIMHHKIVHRGKPYESVKWCCEIHEMNKNSCSQKYLKEEVIQQAFITLFNKLKTNYQHILVPYLDALNSLNLTVLDDEQMCLYAEENARIFKQTHELTALKAQQKIDSTFYYEKMAILNQERAKIQEQRKIITEKSMEQFDIKMTQQLIEVLERYSGIMIDYEEAMILALLKKVVVYEDHLDFQMMNNLQFTEPIM